MANNAGLKSWAHARTQTIDLPSGTGRATVRLLTIGEAIYHDRIPNPLIGVAMRAESGDLDDPTPEDAKEFLDLQCHIVGAQTEKFKPKKGQAVSPKPHPCPCDNEECEVPVHFDPAWVRDEMPPRDREQLFSTITHLIPRKLFEGIVAASLGNLGKFRGGDGSDDVPGDVQADEPEAE